jgi:hypothetical protein
MSSRRVAEAVGLPAILGIGVLAVVLVYWDFRRHGPMVIGFMAGLLGGFVSVLALVGREKFYPEKRWLRLLAILSGPFVRSY